MSPDAEEYHATMILEKLDDVVSERIRQAKQQVNDLREKILEEERKTPPLFPPLSRRDWFAGMAMQEAMNSSLVLNDEPATIYELVARKAVFVADAMLAELDKEGK